MKTIYLILVISLVGNVLLILDEYCVINIIKVECPDGTTIMTNGSCDNKGRYTDPGKEGGGTEIRNEEAITYTTGWVNKYCNANPEMIKCGMISKVAIDSLFSNNASDNVLDIEMGFDDANNSPLMVISSKRDDRYQIITIDAPEKQFKITTVCPTQCEILPRRP